MPETTRKPTTATVMPVRLPLGANRLIRRAAARRHKSVSAFLRDAAVAEANRVLGIEREVPEPAAVSTAA